MSKRTTANVYLMGGLSRGTLKHIQKTVEKLHLPDSSTGTLQLSEFSKCACTALKQNLTVALIVNHSFELNHPHPCQFHVPLVDYQQTMGLYIALPHHSRTVKRRYV